MKADITSLKMKLRNEKSIVALRNNELKLIKIDNERSKIEKQEQNIDMNRLMKEIETSKENTKSALEANESLKENIKIMKNELKDYRAVIRGMQKKSECPRRIMELVKLIKP